MTIEDGKSFDSVYTKSTDINKNNQILSYKP